MVGQLRKPPILKYSFTVSSNITGNAHKIIIHYVTIKVMILVGVMLLEAVMSLQWVGITPMGCTLRIIIWLGNITQMTKFIVHVAMRPPLNSPLTCRPQLGPTLTPRTLLSG